MGRRKDPGELQAAKGNPGKRKQRPPRKPASAAPAGKEPPNYLKGKPARAIWRHLMPQLQEARLIKSVDDLAIARYCYHAAEFWRCAHHCQEHGDSYRTSSPHVQEMWRPRPEFKSLQVHERAMQQLEQALGITVRSRHQLLSVVGQQMHLFDTGEKTAEKPAPESAAVSPVGVLRSAQGSDATH